MGNVIVQYVKGSFVNTKKNRLSNMINAHWDYVDSTINAGTDVTRMYTHDEVMEMREWDYTSAFAHGYGHGCEDSISISPTLTECVERQKVFALNAFGPGDHAIGLLKHIKKEVIEIMEDTQETEEWVDIIILAMEGAWRTGASPEEVSKIFDIKMSKNEKRKWPENQIGEPTEHIKIKPEMV